MRYQPIPPEIRAGAINANADRNIIAEFLLLVMTKGISKLTN